MSKQGEVRAAMELFCSENGKWPMSNHYNLFCIDLHVQYSVILITAESANLETRYTLSASECLKQNILQYI